jgi:hypothetical protein
MCPSGRGEPGAAPGDQRPAGLSGWRLACICWGWSEGGVSGGVNVPLPGMARLEPRPVASGQRVVEFEVVLGLRELG